MDAPTKEKEMKTRRLRSFKISKETRKETDKETGKVIEKEVLKIDRIFANPGDTIRWEVDDTHTVSIWFPHTGVFVTPVIAVMHEGSVEATIRDDVLATIEGDIPMVYEYAIYDHTERQFVTCESHPKIEIPKAGP